MRYYWLEVIRVSSLQDETIKLLTEKLSIKLEMAYPLKDIYRKIDDKCEKIIEHLILCLVFSQEADITVKHWEGEIYNLLNHTYKIQRRNKFPTYKQLCANCFRWEDVLYDNLANTINGLSNIKDLTIPQYNIDNLYNAIINYFKWLYNEFSIKGNVTDIEVFEKIDNLIKEGGVLK